MALEVWRHCHYKHDVWNWLCEFRIAFWLSHPSVGFDKMRKSMRVCGFECGAKFVFLFIAFEIIENGEMFKARQRNTQSFSECALSAWLSFVVLFLALAVCFSVFVVVALHLFYNDLFSLAVCLFLIIDICSYHSCMRNNELSKRITSNKSISASLFYKVFQFFRFSGSWLLLLFCVCCCLLFLLLLLFYAWCPFDSPFLAAFVYICYFLMFVFSVLDVCIYICLSRAFHLRERPGTTAFDISTLYVRTFWIWISDLQHAHTMFEPLLLFFPLFRFVAFAFFLFNIIVALFFGCRLRFSLIFSMIKCVLLFVQNFWSELHNVVFGFDVFIFNFGHIFFFFCRPHRHRMLLISFRYCSRRSCCGEICTQYSCKSMPLHSHDWMVACSDQVK